MKADEIALLEVTEQMNVGRDIVHPYNKYNVRLTKL